MRMNIGKRVERGRLGVGGSQPTIAERGKETNRDRCNKMIQKPKNLESRVYASISLSVVLPFPLLIDKPRITYPYLNN